MTHPKTPFTTPSHLSNGLAYHTFNPLGTPTLLLLHGAGTGAPEWDLVIPHIPPTYHLLVPDLPLHNASQAIPLHNTASDTAALLADLVRSAAKNGTAHVVGLSLGAHVGRRLAVQHPEVVQTCFLSGYASLGVVERLPGFLRGVVPTLVYGTECAAVLIPPRWMDGIEHNTCGTTTPRSLAHFKRIWEMVGDKDIGGQTWAARTLVVAASKGGLVPTNDSLGDARALAGLGGRGNTETRAVQNRGVRHAWNRQDGRLFAEAVVCWVEGRELPGGFEAI